MSLKLKDALFETSDSNIYKLFENKKEREVEGNIQSLSKATLETISKAIAAKINGEIPSLENVDPQVMTKPLGIITFQMLKKLGMVSIKGLKLDPAQVKGEQMQGLSQMDFSKYENHQIVPLFLTNKEMENLGGKKGDDEFAAIFYIPAIYAPISKDNLALHKQLFGIEDPPKGKAAMHIAINKLHYEMIDPKEMELVQKSFMTGNATPLQRIEKMQGRRRPAGGNEKMGGSGDDQNDKSLDQTSDEQKESKKESLNIENLNKLHQNSLASLLFEEKKWYHKFFGGEKPEVEKGSDTSYTFVDVDLDKGLDVDEKPKKGPTKIEKELTSLNAVPSKTGEMPSLGISFLAGESANIGSESVVTIKSLDPFKGSNSKVGEDSYTPAIDINNFKSIVKAICKNDGSIDALKLNKSMPKSKIELSALSALDNTNNSASYTSPSAEPSILIDPSSEKSASAITYKLEGTSFELKNLNVKGNLDILKRKIFTKNYQNQRGGNFSITYSIFNTDETRPIDQVSSFCGPKYLEKIARLAQNFNEKTADDELLVRRFKAANYYIAILRCFNDEFLSNDVDAAYETLCKTDLDADLADSDDYFSKNVQGKVVEDDADANKVKDAIEYLKQRNTANRSAWQGFKHDSSEESKSDASLNAVITNIDDDDADKLLSKTTVEIKDFTKDVERIVKDVKFDFESAKGSVEKGKEVFEYYGEGAELLKKIYQIVTSAIKGDADHVPMSGDQSERVSKKEKTGDFLKEFDKVFKDEFKRLNPILKKEYNIKSKDFVGNEYIIQIAKAIKEEKSIKVDLDELVKRQMDMSNLESFINANAVLRKLKADRADLTTQLEKLDEASFEEDLTKVMTKMIANSIQGILGSKSSMLDHKSYSNNLMLEVSDREKNAATVTFLGTAIGTIGFAIANAITGGVFAAPVLLFGGLATLAGIWKGTVSWREHSENLAGRGKYESMDMYAEAIIETSMPIVLKSCASVVGNMYASGLIGIEDKLKENGVTLTYTSEALEKLSDDVKSNQAKSEKKENLNELGKKIYSEIIDTAYEFKKNSPIGKYISESSVENMLHKTMFSGEIRNKFAKLIDLLQEDEKELQTSGFVYKLGLRSLLKEENEDQDSGESKKSKTRETIEINKLRVQLATIITKEFGTANFKNEINQAFIKELKKHEKDLPGKFTFGDASKKEKIRNVLVKVLNKVLGMSEKDAKEFFEDNANLFETFSRKDIDLILESQDLKMLLEASKLDVVNSIKVDGSNYFIDIVNNLGKPRILKVPIDPSTGAFKGALDQSYVVKSVPTSAQTLTDPAKITRFLQTSQGTYTGPVGAGSGPLDIPTGGIEGFHVDVKSTVQKLSPTPASAPTPANQGNTPAGYDPSAISEMTGTEILAGITSLAVLINLSLMVANWIRPVLHRNIKTGAELQKVLSGCQWDTLPGVAFAEIICQILVANQAALAEQGIKITGKLSKASKPAQAGSVGSSVLVNKIKGSMSPKAAKKLKAENITDDQIADAIRSDLSRICMGIVRKYDKEKYKSTIETADKDAFTQEASSKIYNPFSWFKSKQKDDVINRITGDKIASGREKALKTATKEDVDSLIKAIIGLVRDVKDLNLETVLHLNRLQDLLFEETSLPDGANMPGAKKHTISAEDLQSALNSTGCLVYGSDLDPDTADFRKAENYLIGTIANFLTQNFGVKVSGVDQFKKLNMVEEVIEQTVDKEAPAGQPASQEVANMFGGAGVPMNAQAPFDMSQMLLLMNMCGGQPMFMMMMIMMQHPQILQNLQKMQKQGNSTMQDAIDVLKPEAPEELSDIDQQIAQAIKTARDNLPAIAKKDVQKLWHTIKSDPFSGNKFFTYDLLDVSTDPQSFVANLKQSFRIVDETVNYTPDNTKELTFFVLTKCMENVVAKPNLLSNMIQVYANRAMSKITNQEVDLERFVSETSLSLTYALTSPNDSFDDSRQLDLHTYSDEKQFCNAISGDDNCDDFAALKIKPDDEKSAGIEKLLKDAALAADSFEIKTERRLRRVKPLSRRVKNLQVIKEAKFLEQEFKRLWNLR